MAQPRCGASSRGKPPWAVLTREAQAPIAEEFAFRACMCPLLLNAGYSEARVVFCCPLFFGECSCLGIIPHQPPARHSPCASKPAHARAAR
jgi:hypothetical protein